MGDWDLFSLSKWVMGTLLTWSQVRYTNSDLDLGLGAKIDATVYIYMILSKSIHSATPLESYIFSAIL
jgi:hypothetical protein